MNKTPVKPCCAGKLSALFHGAGPARKRYQPRAGSSRDIRTMRMGGELVACLLIPDTCLFFEPPARRLTQDAKDAKGRNKLCGVGTWKLLRVSLGHTTKLKLAIRHPL